MRTEDLLQSILFAPPPFSEYHGGNSFVHDGKIYKKCRESLGKGAYGEVFCFEASDHTRVAVKSELLTGNEYLFGDDFEIEAKWYQQIYGLGILSGDPKNRQMSHYVLMPFFSGKPLHHIMFTSEKMMLACWIKTAAATHDLHQRHHVIHCDLKSDNVILGEKAFLIDFGFVTRVNELRNTYIENTLTNKYFCSQYSPEIFTYDKKRFPAHQTQDIYSLGILLWQLFSQWTQQNAGECFDGKMQDAVYAVRKNLTYYRPAHRCSIPEAIYMLAVAFFSQIPQSIWFATPINLNHSSTLLDVWRTSTATAVCLRQQELEQEEHEKSKRKTQKINGLKLLRSNIKIKNPAQFGSIVTEAKIKFPELTAGFFSRRTETLIDELSEFAPVFH